MKQIEIEGVRFNCTFDGETETMTAIEDGEDERTGFCSYIGALDLDMGILRLQNDCHPSRKGTSKESLAIWKEVVDKHRLQRIANGFES